MSDDNRLRDELDRLRRHGLTLPRHSGRAIQSYGEAVRMSHTLNEAAGHDLERMGSHLGRRITTANYDDSVKEMLSENQAKMQAFQSKRNLSARLRRQEDGTFRRQSSYGGMGMGGSPVGGDAYNAIPRFYDPLEYWDISGLPWNVADEGHRHKLHKWLRLYYATHYLVPILVDIFTRFPLVGMELEVKDPKLKEVYETIFLDNLKYEDFLVGLGREFWCALPGEMIQGVDGPVSIESVQAGDLVLTHKGQLKPVKGASSREYSGKYVTLRPHYGLPMRYTYGHPFLVRRQAPGSKPSDELFVVDWVPVEDVQISDELFVPVDQRYEDRQTVNVFETLRGWLQVPSEGEIQTWPIPPHITWTNSEARYRSWVARQVKGLTPGDVWKRLGPYAQHSPLKAEIDVTDELLWFFGLYLAEGAVTKDGVRISLHAKEIEYAERVVAIAAGLGLNASVLRGSSENGINVIIYSIAFGAWFKSLLGTGHSEKRIPEWMMLLPGLRQAHILRGYFDGDGHYGDVRVHAASASLSLALQIERMIRRLGVVTTINKASSITEQGYTCSWWMVGPAIGDTSAFLGALDVPDSRPVQQRQFGNHDGPGYWVKVFQLDKTGEYSGPVYNIEVEDDHSYVGSVATHNCVGEAFCLGSFDEDLGVWEHEELINPEDIVINNFPFLNTKQLKIVPPDYLKRIAQTKSPAREWYMLQENFEDLIPYLLKGEHIPVSPVMLRQVANKMNNWDDHGTPILLRGMRTLLHEERLMASQEAIAERLYSPLILAKLGIMDMGDGLPPWLPGPDELESVRDDLDIALSSDFRVMVHHFGLEITNVFGREQMPRLGDDFDRIERRLMQVFGVNPSLLSAGSNAQPYASSALQAEFMNQILRTFQGMLKEHFKERALVVAEAQGHYDFETKGESRIPIYEKIVVVDEETGEKHIEEVNKLLIPELKFACLAYGSRVSTPNGPVLTEDLKPGDMVIGWDLENDCAVPAEVTHSYDNGRQDVYRVTTMLDRQIEATSEHPFLTKEGWVEAGNLRLGLELRVGAGKYDGLIDTDVSPQWDEVRSIDIIHDIPTWSLGIAGDHTHVTEGLVTHNTFDMRDQATERQFLMALRQMGVPIPNEDLLIGIDWNYREKVLQYNKELMEQTIAQQRAKFNTYIALATQGLPIPLDLKAEVESVLVHGAGAGGAMPEGGGGGGMAGAQQQKPGGMPGVVGPAPGAGPPGGIQMPPPPGQGPGLGAGPGTAPPGGGAPPATPQAPGPAGTVPQVSNERRPGLKYNTSNQGHPIIGSREGSDFDQFMADYPHLGLPFVDYVIDNLPKTASLEDIDRGVLLDLNKSWPENAEAYQHKVAAEAVAHRENTPEVQDSGEPATVEPIAFKLKANQELRTDDDGEPTSILEHRSKKRIDFKVSRDKKYSLIDAFADSLTKENDDSEPIAKSIRQPEN